MQRIHDQPDPSVEAPISNTYNFLWLLNTKATSLRIEQKKKVKNELLEDSKHLLNSFGHLEATVNTKSEISTEKMLQIHD